MTRTLEQWKAIVSQMDNNTAARRILEDLVGYRLVSIHRMEDVQQLAIAMTAWAMVGEHPPAMQKPAERVNYDPTNQY
jgi:hypothetical protein